MNSNTSYCHRNNTTGYDGTIYDLSYYQSLYAEEFGEDGPLYPFLTPTGINQDLPYYLSPAVVTNRRRDFRSEEPTSELQSLMRTSYAVFCLKKKTQKTL